MTWMPGGYNDWFSVSVAHQSFQLKFNRKAVDAGTFEFEADRAANLIQQEWGNKPLYLALSGGIDSEFAASVLHKNNIAFTPVILKISDLNALESWYAEYWCYKHNITPIILEYTVEQYAKSLVEFFPKLDKIKNYHQTPILLIYNFVRERGGHCIYAGGDINLADGKFFCDSLDFISNIVDAGDHPTSFFMYTPEFALSYVKPFDIELSEQYNKLSFYNVPQRPKIEYIYKLHHHPAVKPVVDKLHHIFQTEKQAFDPHFWYGTKEQLVHNLQQ